MDGLRAELQSQIETSRADLNTFRQEMREELSGMNGRFGAVERGQAELRERMAKLEGLLEGLREAIAGRVGRDAPDDERVRPEGRERKTRFGNGRRPRAHRVEA